MPLLRSLAVVLLLASPALAADADALRAEAIRLYESGDYAAARAPLEALAESGDADGAMLYRLQLCQSESGDADAARRTLRQAIALLESEAPGSLEASFYLANAYGNVAKKSAAAAIAKAATDRLEAGTWSEPDDGVGAFRYAKLYADQERDDEATRWFERALERLPDDASSASYRRWASGYLADRAGASGDPADTRAALEQALAAGGGDPAQLDRLAVMQAEAGEFQLAAKTWGRALIAAPATGNRARYAQRVALTLHDLGGAVGSAPDGRLWSQLTQPELETVLGNQARKVVEIKQAAEPVAELSRERAGELTRQLQEIRPVFFTASMQYLIRGLPLREMAFQAGIAPLLFRSNEWQVSAPRRKGKAKGKRP